MVLLMATLFWALWTKTSASAVEEFSNTSGRAALLQLLEKRAHPIRRFAEGSGEHADYQALKQSYESASQKAAPPHQGNQREADELSGKISGRCKTFFTGSPAYVKRADLQHRDRTSAPQKKSLHKDLDEYKKRKRRVEYPDGKKVDYDFEHLEETYNELKE